MSLTSMTSIGSVGSIISVFSASYSALYQHRHHIIFNIVIVLKYKIGAHCGRRTQDSELGLGVCMDDRIHTRMNELTALYYCLD